MMSNELLTTVEDLQQVLLFEIGEPEQGIEEKAAEQVEVAADTSLEKMQAECSAG